MSRSRVMTIIGLLIACLLLSGVVAAQTQIIAQVDVNPQGEIVAGGTYGFLKVWDADGNVLADLSNQIPAEHHILSVAWDPEGVRFATGSSDGLIRIWDLSKSNEPITILDQIPDVWIRSVAWNPTGTKLASVSGSGDYDIFIWDAVDYLSEPILKARSGDLTQVKWRPIIGDMLATTHLDAGALIFDESLTMPDRLFDLRLEGSASSTGGSYGIAWNADGSKIAIGNNDGLIEIWTVNDRSKPIMQLEGHSEYVTALAWNPDGRLASYSTDGTLRIWDTDTGETIYTYEVQRTSILSNISWTADGNQLVYADDTLEPVIVTPPTITESQYPLPEGTFVFVWFDEVYTWRLSDPEPTQITNGAMARQAVWSADGNRIAYIGRVGDYYELLITDVDGTDTTQITNNSNILGVSWSPNGQKLAYEAHTDNSEVYIINPDGSGKQNITNHPATDDFLAWSPDSRYLAISSDRGEDSNLYIFDTLGIIPPRQLTNDVEFDIFPVWSPDGSQIAFARQTPTECSRIYTINVDGTDLTPITPENMGICEIADLIWLPDTEKIMYMEFSVLYEVQPDGTGKEVSIIGAGGSLVGYVDYLPPSPDKDAP